MTTTPGPGEPVDAPVEGPAAVRRGLFGRFKHAAWWVHVVATLSAVVTALVVAVVVAALLYVNISWESTASATSGTPPQEPLSAGVAADLAQRFTPILRYDREELFVPIPRSAYLGLTQLRQRAGKVEQLLQETVTEDSLPAKHLASCPAGCFLFLDVRSAEPHPPRPAQAAYGLIQKKLMRTGIAPTVYYHVTKYTDTDEVAVQYWFLYLFNYRLNEHESDWEQITVRLDENHDPIGVYYSAHEGGNIRSWDKIEHDGDHPVVYPARGSHANYFERGRHRVPVVCRKVIGVIKQCVEGRSVVVDVNVAGGEELGVGDYDRSELTGPLFIGSYGSGNYVVLTRKADVLRDPRVRGAWLDPLKSFRD